MKTIKVNNTTINFNEANHRYTDEKGNILISVTAITGMIDKSGALMGWVAKMMGQYLVEKIGDGEVINEEIIIEAKKEYRKVSKQAMNYGTLIHEWIEKWIAGEKPEIPNEPIEVINGITAFLKWQKEHKAKFLESEKICYSQKHNYVGTLDAIAEIDGKLCLIDFKSSVNFYPEMFLQAAGYVIPYEEETKKKIDEIIIIRLGKNDGEFEVKMLDEFKKERKAFLSCLNVKKYLCQIKNESISRNKN